MAELKFRHEAKHIINLMDYYCISQRLRAVCKLDKNAKKDRRYHIRSLYFDSIEDTALREKMDGLIYRDKYRIRIYDLSDETIRLEKKSKINGLCNKRQTKLTKKECESIIKGDISWMSKSKDPLILDFYANIKSRRLRPKTIVDYNREAYVYPYGNVRITFDSNIKSGVYQVNLFDENLPTVPVNSDSTLLMEVKFDEFLPDVIRDIIQSNERKTTAYSKYSSCRIYG